MEKEITQVLTKKAATYEHYDVQSCNLYPWIGESSDGSILYRDEIGNKIECTLMLHNAMVITSGLHMIKVINATTLDGDIKVSIVSPFFRNKHFKELFASIFLMVFTVNLCTIMLGFCIYAVACVNLWLQQSASEPFHFMHRLVFQTQISD